MGGQRINPESNVNKVRLAAEAAGFTVLRSQSKDRISLDISRHTDKYEYIAYFQRNPRSDFYQWSYAQQIIDGTETRLFSMTTLIRRLADAGKTQTV